MHVVYMLTDEHDFRALNISLGRFTSSNRRQCFDIVVYSRAVQTEGNKTFTISLNLPTNGHVHVTEIELDLNYSSTIIKIAGKA